LEEKKQAEVDKATEEVSEIEVASADLKPGERKVISDGSDGPVVELIKRTTPESEPGPEPAADAKSEAPEKTDETEKTGE
jgi:small subunit ribosomal protein S2